jgi:hypothetical protein
LLAIHVHLVRQACNAEYTNYSFCVLPSVCHNILKVIELYIALDWSKCKFLVKAVVANGNLFRVLAFTIEISDRKYSCLEQRSVAWVNNGE